MKYSLKPLASIMEKSSRINPPQPKVNTMGCTSSGCFFTKTSTAWTIWWKPFCAINRPKKPIQGRSAKFNSARKSRAVPFAKKSVSIPLVIFLTCPACKLGKYSKILLRASSDTDKTLDTEPSNQRIASFLKNPPIPLKVLGKKTSCAVIRWGIFVIHITCCSKNEAENPWECTRL